MKCKGLFNRLEPGHRLVILLALVIMMGAGLAGCISGQDLTAQPPTQRSDRRLILGNNTFAFRFLAGLHDEKPKENVFVSPFSVYLALMMAADGAAGETREALLKTLDASGLSREEINRGLSNLLSVLENPDPKVQLSIANSLWMSEASPVKSAFTQNAREFYRATVRELDFMDPDSPAVINEWVNQATGGKIPSIVETIDPEIILFLINAIHFQGTWTHQFNPNRTTEGSFHSAAGGPIAVPMMHLRTDFDYLEVDDLQIIRLPYGEKNVSMLIFLPDMVRSNLDQVIRHVAGRGWKDWLDQMEETRVNLVLPRFTIEFESNLNQVLSRLGMEVAFDPDQADFSGIVTPPPDAYLSRVAHKTFLSIGEEGTEAAATTAVEVGITSAPLDEISMVIDRPFLCAILDEISGMILFTGIIQNPD